jgi:ATP-grasp domain, R2K clade family 2
MRSGTLSVRGLILVVPEKRDPERDRVVEAWTSSGGTVIRLGRFWEPPILDPKAVRIYGNDTFALVLAQKLGLHLVSPPDDLLAHLTPEWLKRRIEIRQLAEAASFSYPTFVKPIVPKLFRAATYLSEADLATECKGLESGTRVLVSEVVAFLAEARCFLLRDEVQDVAVYEGEASLDGATVLMQQVAKSELLPEACVLDIGLIADRGWAVIEANAPWGAGLNGCNAEKVISCIAASTKYET